MSRRPFSSWRPHGVLTALAAALAGGAAVWAYVREAPHAALVDRPSHHQPAGAAALARCLDCHVPFLGSPSTRCLGPGCHGDLATGTPPRDGPAMPVRYHVVVRKQACSTCHEEHRIGGRIDVHGAVADPELRAACQKCHSARRVPAHARTDEEPCGVCHADASWRADRARHEKLHTQACEVCHRAPEGHPRVAGTCLGCHQTRSWTQVSVAK